MANLDLVHASDVNVSASSTGAAVSEARRNVSSKFNGSVESVSSFFAKEKSAAELAGLCRNAFQIPFYFLKLAQRGDFAAASHPVNMDTISMAYRCILQRHVETADVILQHQQTHSQLSDLIEFLFRSPEWKRRSAELFVLAFPDKKRIWHPHIPKTAGSSFFSAAYESPASYFNTNILESASSLSELADSFRIQDGPILISGHFSAYQFANAIGPFDQIVTFVRDPLERAKSMFQYSRDVVDGSKNVHKADSAPLFAAGFVYDSFEQSFKNGYFPPNLQCTFITPRATCSAAIDTCALRGIDISTIDHVDDKIRELFHRSRRIRSNVSRNSSTEILSPELAARFRAANAEDEMLYQAVRSQRSRIQLGNLTERRANAGGLRNAEKWLAKLKELF